MSKPPDSPKPPADLRFRCPACKGKIVVDHSAVGFYANCPHCRERILIRRQMADVVPATPSPAPRPVREIPLAAQTASGIKPIPGGAPVLSTTQKIGALKSAAPPLPTAPARELLTTQKISPSAPKPSAVPPSPPPAGPPDAASSAASDKARQSLTNLIDGLKRENQELKKKLADFNPATSTVAGLLLEEHATVPDAVAIAHAELAKLRESLAKFEAERKQALAAAAALQGELDAARKNLDASVAREANLADRIPPLEAQLAAQSATAAALDKTAREATDEAARLRALAARQTAAATTGALDLATLRDVLARTQRDLAEASRSRDASTADVALARQSLRDDSRLIAAACAESAATKSELAAAATERDSLSQQLASATTKLDESAVRIRDLDGQLQRAPKPAELEKLRDAAATLSGERSAIRAELAGLRMSEQAFRNQYTETASELRTLRDDLRRGAERAGELQKTADQSKAELATALEQVRAAQTKIDRLSEENERLLSEKSALGIALDEAKDRAQQLDAEKWRAEELARKLAALTEQHEATTEQLAAANNVAADMRASLKRIDELEVENTKLREQIKKTEHEIAMRASPHGLELVESRFRRRIEELEATLNTAGSVTQSLRARITELEKDQRRAPLPDQDATRAHDEKVAALQKQIFEAESLARKAQGERDTALRAKVEAEAAVDALSGQARDLQDHLDALNKKIAATPAAPILAELPPPSPRKTKHGATHHGEVKIELPAPITEVKPPPAPAPEPDLRPAKRTQSNIALLAVVLAIVISFFALWYFEIIAF